MSKFKSLFEKIKGRPAYIPFLILGDPTPKLSLHIIQSVIEAGVDAIELGIPFSDPIADGPQICKASLRARQSGIDLNKVFEMISYLRSTYPMLPIGLLVYANIAYQQGISSFYERAHCHGVDAVLLPDVPSEEAHLYVVAAKDVNIDPILLATPSCQSCDLLILSKLSSGFTYVVTRKGVTGTRYHSEFESSKMLVDKLHSFNAPPPVFGFGIQTAKDVRMAYDSGAKGVIIGSALIHRISQLSSQDILLKDAVKNITREIFGI